MLELCFVSFLDLIEYCFPQTLPRKTRLRSDKYHTNITKRGQVETVVCLLMLALNESPDHLRVTEEGQLCPCRSCCSRFLPFRRCRIRYSSPFHCFCVYLTSSPPAILQI